MVSQLLVRYDSDAIAERAGLRRAKPGDAGLDLYNASDRTITVAPGASVDVYSGLRVKIPEGYVGFVRPRSSTFTRRGLFVIEGVIDSGYTGPLYSLVWNPALNGKQHPVLIAPWERLSQLVVVPCPALDILRVAEMPTTARGAAGFGSTGC